MSGKCSCTMFHDGGCPNCRSIFFSDKLKRAAPLHDAKDARIASLEAQLAEAREDAEFNRQACPNCCECIKHLRSDRDEEKRLREQAEARALAAEQERDALRQRVERLAEYERRYHLVLSANEGLQHERDTLRQWVEGLEKRAAEIADDFYPGSDKDAPLALQEMREAIAALATLPTADHPIAPNKMVAADQSPGARKLMEGDADGGVRG